MCSISEEGKKMKPRGFRFTLIELLMIISIIIILMSLLMPSLRTGKEKAMQIKCASNMKQIAIATNVYGSDYGYWPAARYPGYIRGNAYWDTPFEYIAPYIDPKANQSTAWSSKSPFGYTQSVMELVNCPRARKEDLCGSYTLQYYSSYTVPGGGYALLAGKSFRNQAI
jgi:type II secretory pathway pseudopilin PulG